MKNETIDKLKNAGYITVTDDSQGIADKVGIGGSPVSPTDPSAHKNDYFTIEICDPAARGDEIEFGVDIVNNGESSIILDQTLIDALDSYYKNIQYRVNGEGEWNNLKLSPNESMLDHEIAPGEGFGIVWDVNETVLWLGDKIEFKHDGELNFASFPGYQTISTNIKMYLNKTVDVYGNIMSLLHGDNFKNQTVLTQPFCLAGLFSDNTNTLRNAGGLVLPATTLTMGCYTEMFSGCKNLITAPQLPATTLAPNCYAQMFNGCEKLYANPYHLPATTLAPNCYLQMFTGTDISYFKVDAENVDSPAGLEAPVWAEVVSILSFGFSVLEINDFELYREVPEIQIGDDPGVPIIFVKRTDQYIDFYGDQKKKYLAAALNKLSALYPDLKEIWEEKGDSDLSAYHIRLNGNDIGSVSYEESESDPSEQRLVFITEVEDTDTKYNLSWGVDGGTNVILYDVSKLSSIVFKTTGKNSVPWAQMNITDKLYEKWNTLLMSYDGHKTTDPDELAKFDVSFEDLDEPLHLASIIEDEEGPNNPYMYFSASQGHTEAQAKLYPSTKTITVTVESVG